MDDLATATLDVAPDVADRASSTLTIGNAAPQDVAIVSYEVSWALTDAQVSRENLATLLIEEGFKPYVPRRAPSERRNLRRAIYIWAAGRTGELLDEDDEDRADVSGRKKLIREIRTRAERGKVAPVVFALVEEFNLGSRMGLRYATAYRFRYDPALASDQEGSASGTLTVSSSAFGEMDAENERSQVLSEILPIWERQRNLYNGNDLAAILLAIVKDTQAISVESGSGIWAVPARYLGVVERLERLMVRLAGLDGAARCHLRVRENIGWARTLDALRQGALDTVLSDIRAIATSVEGLEEQSTIKPGSVQVATLAGVMTELIAVREKTKLWGEISGLRESRIDRELAAVGARAVTINTINREARQSRMAEASTALAASTVNVNGLGEGRAERLA